MKSNDVTVIIDMASEFMTKGHHDTKVRGILALEDPTSDDLSYLLKYVASCQRVGLHHDGTLSIRSMKDNIFRLIGKQPKNEYGGYSSGSTMSRADVVSIYNFIIGLPTEYFENRLK